MKIFNYIVSAAFCTLTMASCTDLSETLYDQVASGNYYNILLSDKRKKSV